MDILVVGDIVGRKSYGGDLYFRIIDIKTSPEGVPVYVLRGLEYRIQADSYVNDLVKYDPKQVRNNMRTSIASFKKHQVDFSQMRGLFTRDRVKPGRILHIDSSEDFMNMCLKYYREAGISCAGKVVSESSQPAIVGSLLESYKPELLVLTGHDSMKKGSTNKQSISSYSNSQYYVESVKEARRYEKSYDKLCIFAGACQSYFEAIMDAGANFASSPERVLIHALDPAMVTEKVAMTDSRIVLRPKDVIYATKTGPTGIGGIETRGHLQVRGMPRK